MKFAEFQKNIKTEKATAGVSDNSGDKIQNLEAILNIVNSINRSLILQDVLELVVKNSIAISNSERGFIVLENSNGVLEFSLGLDSQGNKLPEAEFSVSNSVVEDVFKSGHSKFIEGAQSDASDFRTTSIFRLDLQTILCSPLIAGKKKIGVIYVDSKSIQRINVKEITATFEILAGQAATAIKNAQLYYDQIEAYEQLHKTNEDLIEAKQAAEKSEKLKSEFLAQMSHEIRTPINSILNFTSLLKEELAHKVGPELGESFQIIDSGGRRIIRTIDLILNMSQIQTDSYTANFEIVNLDELISRIIDDLWSVNKKEGIDLSFDKQTDRTCFEGDSYTVGQIFVNLIENAIKYTSEGSIRIKMYLENERLSVDIADTGVGISESYLANMFSPFSQEEMGYTRKFEGNGLGLALVKKYCEINNALIKVKSKKGEGSTFSVTFPITQP